MLPVDTAEVEVETLQLQLALNSLNGVIAYATADMEVDTEDPAVLKLSIP